jgi:REP element-mobilizing transposase RayT
MSNFIKFDQIFIKIYLLLKYQINAIRIMMNHIFILYTFDDIVDIDNFLYILGQTL